MANENEYKTRLEEALLTVNCIKFQIDLWEKVKLVVEEDGTKRAINGEYLDDPLFPVLKVKGYNPYTKKEEEHTLRCWAIISDWTMSDWREEYEETGDSPAYLFPEGVEGLLFCAINDLRLSLRSAEERLEAVKKLESEPKDTATYYLLGETLVGKRNEGKDYLFIDADWIPDEDGIIGKLLKGEDLTKYKLKMFDVETAKEINTIKELSKEEANKPITDQTVEYLLDKWSKEYADAAENWKEFPQWFSKCVDIKFEMNGIRKIIDPKDFRFPNCSCEDAFLENIYEDICKDLKKYGAYGISLDGLPD